MAGPASRLRRGVEDPSEQKQILSIVGKLYEAFVATDAMLTEINPLIVTPDGEVKALDSKFTVDDAALFRHPDIAEMRDLDAVPPEERAAREKGVTYVKLDGEVGILGNGAGLVMSTLDVIALAGGRPANFCDLGGGGDAEGVVDALGVITADPQVKSIFFNVFGGITRCDEVARGILAALDRMTIEHPIVVRLDGTNAEQGREILKEASPPNLHVEPTMLDAARRAVELAHDRRLVRAGGGVPPERDAQGGARPRPAGRVVRARRRRSGARRRDRRRPRGAPALGGRSATSSRSIPRRGCSPTVVARAEDIPFADGSFDVVACRIAAHHFGDVPAAIARDGACLARPRRGRGQPLHGEEFEEAESLHDPTHVRCYSEQEWRELFAEAGLEVERRARSSAGSTVEPWLARVETPRRRRSAGHASCSPTGSRTAA